MSCDPVGAVLSRYDIDLLDKVSHISRILIGTCYSLTHQRSSCQPTSPRTSMPHQDGMTVGFVRATKAYILPTVLDDVFRFRKAFLTADAILRTIFSAISTSNGTATAVSALRGNYADTSIDCQGYQPTGYSSDCPWGLLSFIESAASSLGVNGTFSEVEVREEALLLDTVIRTSHLPVYDTAPL